MHHEIKKDSTEAGVVYVVAQGVPAWSDSSPLAAAELATYGSRRPPACARGSPLVYQGTATAAWASQCSPGASVTHLHCVWPSRLAVVVPQGVGPGMQFQVMG